MSLTKYTNTDTVTLEKGARYGVVFTEVDIETLGSDFFYADASSVGDGDLFTEIHVYTLRGDYVGSTYDNRLIVDGETGGFFVDVREVFNILGINNGSFTIVVNVIAPLFGNSKTEENKPFFIQEISPSRQELKLTINNNISTLQLQQFRDYAFGMNSVSMLNSLIVNFGNNETYKVINLRFDERDQNVFYIKTYSELSDDIEEYRRGWFGLEVIDPYIDTVLLKSPERKPNVINIRGPRFDIDTDLNSSDSTIYYAWNDLLDSDTQTTQNILDSILSGSNTATLNIDYSDYGNFVFYGRAEERLRNFVAKIEQIETYTGQITELSASDSGDSAYTLSSRNTIQNRIDVIKNNFDHFERWLYYHDTGSLFTHGISGSLTPYPKYVQDDRYVINATSDQVVVDWFNSNLQDAIEFDRDNYKSLWWTIPEHILMNDASSNYVTFVNMVGHHFDNIWTYIKALTSIHEKEEHPELGATNSLLFHIAKSFGWTVQDARSLSKLWDYKLGTDSTGSLQTSSGMMVKSHEFQTHQIWKRIVNNLPYLLKTKGTSRSVKALMSIYGIPQTLLSIKEYGGPGIEGERPIFEEDMFTYKLNLDSNSYIEIPQDTLSVYPWGWGDGTWCGAGEDASATSTGPLTYELRFSTLQNEVSASLPLFTFDGGSLNVVPAVKLEGGTEGTASLISGSEYYGKLEYDLGGSKTYSEYLPIFDGDLWNIRIFKDGSSRVIHIAKSSDCAYGEISHEDKFTVTNSTITTVYLGQSDGTNKFEGSIQNYREYYTTFSDETFYNHVLNPNAYNVDSPSGSFYSLYRYYPFGSDLQRDDITSGDIVSSSHPDREQTPTNATYQSFTGTQETQYDSVNERFFSQLPTIGGVANQSKKIRIENDTLLYDLSPEARGAFSEYDDRTHDSNRLAIVFSQAEQIDRDISNHMGFANLDDWIGDPEEEFENGYKTLNNKKYEYFQKYNQRNDINKFIRLLSIYDYTFFEQLRQLVPAKADLITGILVEPHILNRSKVQLSKRPTITNPQWDDTIVYELNQSGKYQPIRGEFEIEQEARMGNYDYRGEVEFDFDSEGGLITPIGPRDPDPATGSRGGFNKSGWVQFGDDTHMDYMYESGSILSGLDADGKSYNQISGSCYATDGFTGTRSGSVTEWIDDYSYCNTGPYRRKVCYIDAYPMKFSGLKNPNLYAPGGTITSWGGSGTTAGDGLYSNPKDTHRFKNAFSGTSMTQTFTTTYTGKAIIRVFAAPPTPSSNLDPISISVTVNGDNLGTKHTIAYEGDDGKYYMQEVRFVYDSQTTNAVTVTAGSTVYFYSIESHPYRTRWEEGFQREKYRIWNVGKNCAEERWNYQIIEDAAHNRSRFKGSKLTGKAINIDSSETIDGGPVVVKRKTNPNNLSTNFPNSEGNLRLE